jgi:probable HAF family extracellular repeat protein
MLRCSRWLGVGLMTLLMLAVVSVIASSRATAAKSKPRLVNYTMTLLPLRSDGWSFWPGRMNNAGDVIGNTNLYVAETGTLYELNVLLAGQVPNGGTIVNAGSINEPLLGTRQIAGYFGWEVTPGALDWVFHAFRASVTVAADGSVTGSAFTQLPEPTGFTQSNDTAVVINNWGDVVGQVNNGGGTASRAIIWYATGGALLFGPPNAYPRGINDAGQVAGTMSVNGESHAFRFDPATGIHDLGGLPRRPASTGYGINSIGQVTGCAWGSQVNYSNEAFSTNGTKMVDLGALYSGRGAWSWGVAINSSGQVVGYTSNSSTASAGFLYVPGSGMVDLSTLITNPPAGLDPRTIQPGGINDYGGHNFGQVAGVATVNGVRRAFVLTPDR